MKFLTLAGGGLVIIAGAVWAMWTAIDLPGAGEPPPERPKLRSTCTTCARPIVRNGAGWWHEGPGGRAMFRGCRASSGLAHDRDNSLPWRANAAPAASTTVMQ